MAIYETRFLNKPRFPDWSNAADVPQYEWVGDRLYRNAWRTYQRAGQSPYQREGRQAIARRSGGGIEWTRRPTAGALAFVGHDPSQPYEYNGKYWLSQTVRDVEVNQTGRTPPEQLQYEYDESYEQARQANLERYQEGIELLEQMGVQRREDIGERFAGLQSQARQELVSRGLVGSTVLPTVQAGIAESEQDALGRLEEALLQQRLNWVEARTDTYPDIRPYLQLLADYGQYAGGPPSVPSYGGGSPARGSSLLADVDNFVRDLLSSRQSGLGQTIPTPEGAGGVQQNIQELLQNFLPQAQGPPAAGNQSIAAAGAGLAAGAGATLAGMIPGAMPGLAAYAIGQYPYTRNVRSW